MPHTWCLDEYIHHLCNCFLYWRHFKMPFKPSREMANMEKIYIYIYTHHLSGTYEYFYL